MKIFEINQVTLNKAALSKDLAKLPVGEKLRILDALRVRSEEIARAGASLKPRGMPPTRR